MSFDTSIRGSSIYIISREQALATLRIPIQQTVVCVNLSCAFGCETVHGMFVELRKRFNPTDEAREREVIQCYQKLRYKVTAYGLGVDLR